MMKAKKNRFEMDMCSGPIFGKLISFSLPLMLSSILQLLFNAVDVMVVGKFAGADALAAVGATTALINICTTLFIGISLGVSVSAARFFATGHPHHMSDTVHTAISIAIIGGIAMIFVGMFGSRPALLLLGTPDNVIDQSVLYMRIYFCGMPAFMLYNFGAAILRAVGDTKRPLLFLIISGISNALLNILLVVRFHLGVAGVGIATVVSLVISCTLVLRCLCRTEGSYRLYFSKLRINKKRMLEIFRVGIPAGLQSMIINVSNAMLQSSVNSFGSDAMAGYTAANNLLGFIYVSINSVSQTCMTFTSQNCAAGLTKRMDKVLRNCFFISFITGLALGSLFYFGGPYILQIYTSEQVVIDYGMQVLKYTTLTYFLCGWMDLIPGALRGMGHSAAPMILSVIGTVGSRIVWIYGIFPLHRSVSFLFISYPASWIITICMQLICYYFIRKKVYRSITDAQT